MIIAVLKPTLHDLLYLVDNVLPYDVVCEGITYRVFDTPDYSINLAIRLEEIYPIAEFLEECKGRKCESKPLPLTFNDVEEIYSSCLIDYVQECFIAEETLVVEEAKKIFAEIVEDAVTISFKLKKANTIPKLDKYLKDNPGGADFKTYIKEFGEETVRPIMEQFDCGVERINAMVERTFPKFPMTKAARS
tara:strand:+ start:32710 stop:33282 length:573 start_codon:yes stop_codon:yes gene_type:complete